VALAGDFMAVEFDEFKGHKMIKLIGDQDQEGKYPFSFGKNKAKLIVANYEAIKKFAEE
jgi:hypothetical protein